MPYPGTNTCALIIDRVNKHFQNHDKYKHRHDPEDWLLFLINEALDEISEDCFSEPEMYSFETIADQCRYPISGASVTTGLTDNIDQILRVDYDGSKLDRYLYLTEIAPTTLLNTWTITFSVDLITANSFTCKINGRTIGPVVYATSHAATMTAIATAIQADVDVNTCTSSNRVLTVTGYKGVEITFTDAAVTLGATQPTTTTANSSTETAGTPGKWYEQWDGGVRYLCITPTPDTSDKVIVVRCTTWPVAVTANTSIPSLPKDFWPLISYMTIAAVYEWLEELDKAAYWTMKKVDPRKSALARASKRRKGIRTNRRHVYGYHELISGHGS